MSMPKEIVMKVNAKGWMIESLMKEWLTECYGERLGAFFSQEKALLVLDSMRVHITDSVIPGSTMKCLRPLDISVNRAFKVALQFEWKAACEEQLLLPVDPDSVGQCEEFHDHQRLDCCAMKRTAQAQIHLETKVTLRATMKERLRKCVTKSFWGSSIPTLKKTTSVVLVRRRKITIAINDFSGRLVIFLTSRFTVVLLPSYCCVGAVLQALFRKKHLFNWKFKNSFCINISCYNVDTRGI